MKEKISRLIDDINWEIAMFLKFGPEKDGIFANLLIPALVAFITALVTIAKFS